jgi:hypothetical protein
MRDFDRIMRNWTNEQWDAAERVEKEAIARLGDVYANVSCSGLAALVIEEQKRHPETTLQDVLELAIILGVEKLFSLRHGAKPNQQKKAVTRPRVTKVPRVRGV